MRLAWFTSVIASLIGGVVLGQGRPNLADAYYHFTLAEMYDLRQDYSSALEEFNRALQADPQSVGVRVEMAKTLAQMGEVEKAAEVCREAIELEPRDVEANYLLGRIFFSSRSLGKTPDAPSNRRDEALTAFERVLEIDPNHVPSLRDAAEIYFEIHEFLKSSQLFLRLRQLDPSEIAYYYSEAQALIELGRIDDAIQALNEGLQVRDDIPEYLLLLGSLYRRQGDFDTAIEVYRGGLSRGPEPRLNEALAQALVAAGRGAEALPILERLVAMLPQDTELRLDLGRAYRQSGNLARSREVLEELVEKEPDNLQVGFELANLLAAMGERDLAMEKLQALLDTNLPGSRHFRPFLQRNLAYLRQQSGDHGEAVRLLKELADEDPNNLGSQLQLFYAYHEAGLSKEALDLSDSLLRDHPAEPDVLIARGQALADAGDLDKATELLDEAAQNSPESEVLYLAASQLCVNDGRFERALGFVDSGLGSHPGSIKLRFQKGAVLERMKNYSEAEQEFKLVLESNPDYAEVLNYLGYMLAEMGVRLGEALDYIQRAVALDPENGAYLDSLGWVYFKQDQLEKAEVHLREAAKIEDSDPVILEHLGDLYSKKGDLGEARRFYEESIRCAEKEEELQRVRKKLESLHRLAGNKSRD